MKFYKPLIFSLLLSVSSSSFALGAVSRACFVSELSDNNLASPALLLFRYLGMPIHFYEVRNKSKRQQEEYAILESITTDYGLVRYYLFAASRAYKMFKDPFYGTTEWRPHAQYESQWGATTMDPEVLKDSRLAMFWHNRNITSSVRAGSPDFVEQISFRSDEMRARMVVTGKHWYWDPSTKTGGSLPDTTAFDCNLYEMGFR